MPYSLRYSFPWFSFFSLEGTYEGVGFAGYIYFIHNTLSLLYCKRFFPLCTDLHVFFMIFFCKAIPRGKLLCLCFVHLPITRVRLSFHV